MMPAADSEKNETCKYLFHWFPFSILPDCLPDGRPLRLFSRPERAEIRPLKT
jgi:hypothetical protein